MLEESSGSNSKKKNIVVNPLLYPMNSSKARVDSHMLERNTIARYKWKTCLNSVTVALGSPASSSPGPAFVLGQVKFPVSLLYVISAPFPIALVFLLTRDGISDAKADF